MDSTDMAQIHPVKLESPVIPSELSEVLIGTMSSSGTDHGTSQAAQLLEVMIKEEDKELITLSVEEIEAREREEKRRKYEMMKEFRCEVCGKYFHRSADLRRHSLSHSGMRPYVCSICGKGFAQKPHLATHALLHAEQKPFPCPICEKGYTQRQKLDSHIKIVHEQSRPYVCSLCGKTFARPDTYKLHMKRHDGYRPFACHFCGRTFTQSYHYKNHMAIHNNTNPNVCVLCDKSFSDRGSLNRHRKKVHKLTRNVPTRSELEAAERMSGNGVADHSSNNVVAGNPAPLENDHDLQLLVTDPGDVLGFPTPTSLEVKETSNSSNSNSNRGVVILSNTAVEARKSLEYLNSENSHREATSMPTTRLDTMENTKNCHRRTSIMPVTSLEMTETSNNSSTRGVAILSATVVEAKKSQEYLNSNSHRAAASIPSATRLDMMENTKISHREASPVTAIKLELMENSIREAVILSTTAGEAKKSQGYLDSKNSHRKASPVSAKRLDMMENSHKEASIFATTAVETKKSLQYLDDIIGNTTGHRISSREEGLMNDKKSLVYTNMPVTLNELKAGNIEREHLTNDELKASIEREHLTNDQVSLDSTCSSIGSESDGLEHLSLIRENPTPDSAVNNATGEVSHGHNAVNNASREVREHLSLKRDNSTPDSAVNIGTHINNASREVSHRKRCIRSEVSLGNSCASTDTNPRKSFGDSAVNMGVNSRGVSQGNISVPCEVSHGNVGVLSEVSPGNSCVRREVSSAKRLRLIEKSENSERSRNHGQESNEVSTKIGTRRNGMREDSNGKESELSKEDEIEDKNQEILEEIELRNTRNSERNIDRCEIGETSSDNQSHEDRVRLGTISEQMEASNNGIENRKRLLDSNRKENTRVYESREEFSDKLHTERLSNIKSEGLNTEFRDELPTERLLSNVNSKSRDRELVSRSSLRVSSSDEMCLNIVNSSKENSLEYQHDESEKGLREDGLEIEETNLELEETSSELRETNLDLRENSMDLRGNSLDSRGKHLDLRGNSLELRENSFGSRENSIDLRENSLEYEDEDENEEEEEENEEDLSSGHATEYYSYEREGSIAEPAQYNSTLSDYLSQILATCRR
uniref:Gastrula zinc finger protein XlCGF8.2DB n=1 Tax=Cacopsylla melanoneura TaxID=428564 RepID=A0A8D8WM20_9HEMI